MNQISLLLGAGFSANQGYPTASQINQKLTDLDPEDFWIQSDGTLEMKNRGDLDPCTYSSYYKVKFFLIDLIKLYKNLKQTNFNYEEFYDFYNEIQRGENNIKEFDVFCESFKCKFQLSINNIDLLSKTNIILNQLIGQFLIDKEGNKFYKKTRYTKPKLDGYTGFLNCLEKWGQGNIVHIHSLNHDIFLESFNNSDWIQANLCDGFDEKDSPYYGKIGNNQKIQLSYFSNEYQKQYRLYKLHGSIDQFPFHTTKNGIETYIKIKAGIKTTDLIKKIENEENSKYINDWINYHPDFLSGTTSKILRYNESIYYKRIFKHFEANLQSSKVLIIIGYGFNDIEINNVLNKKYNNNINPLFIVEPFPSDKTYKIVEKFNAKLITKNPENLEIEDFQK